MQSMSLTKFQLFGIAAQVSDEVETERLEAVSRLVIDQFAKMDN